MKLSQVGRPPGLRPLRARAAQRAAMTHRLEILEPRTLLSSTAFQNAVNYSVQGSPDFVALADFNGDGLLDLVTSSYSASGLSVRLGRTDGTFLAATNITVSASPDFVAAADLNRDGKADLITANFDTNTISVLIGNGNGTFQAATSYAAGTGSRAFAIGDFNGDNFLDLVMAKSFDTTVTFLRGNGNGTFQAPVNYTVNFTPTDVVAGDFNGDGKLDIASCDYFTDKVNVSLGNGNGTFQSAVSIAVGTGPSSIAAGDFNGDGKLDLATANFFGNNVSVLRGTGTGTFQSALNFSAGSGATFVTCADLNVDGKLDLVVANANGDNISALVGNGAASFTLDHNYAVGTTPRSIAVGRLNGDTLPDLVVTNQASNNVSVLLAIPTAAPPVADAGGPYNVNEGGTVVVNGSGSTGTSLTYAWDLDGDGIFGETGAGATRGNETGISATFLAAGLDGPGMFLIRLRVTDGGGLSSTSTATVNVLNVPPILVISGPSSINAGATYTLSLSRSDPGPDTITQWVIDWGDGMIETISGNPSAAQHVYTAVGATFSIHATASDEDGTWNANALAVSVLSPDTTPPTASANAANITAGGAVTYRFTVTYNDNVGIDLASLDGNDILVTGPNGFSQLARFISVATGTGNARIATYELSAPGGAWAWTANGTYSITARAGQVFDTSGNALAASTLRTFAVNIIPPDSGGNTQTTGTDIGAMTAGRIKVIDDFIGALDRNDYFKFSVTSPVSLIVKLYNLAANADLQLLDAAGNRILYLHHSGNTAEAFTRTMSVGTYYMRVLFSGSGGTNYRLRMEAQSAAPSPPTFDDTTASARDIGTIAAGTVRTYDDSLGTDDRNDLYRFTVTESTHLYIKLYNLTDNADLQILDSEGNRIAYAKRSGTSAETLDLHLSAGTYYVRALFAGTMSTNYRLRVEGLAA